MINCPRCGAGVLNVHPYGVCTQCVCKMTGTAYGTGGPIERGYVFRSRQPPVYEMATPSHVALAMAEAGA